MFPKHADQNLPTRQDGAQARPRASNLGKSDATAQKHYLFRVGTFPW